MACSSSFDKITVAILILLPLLLAKSLDGKTARNEPFPKDLGTFNGSSYFVEDINLMNWAQAWQYCNSFNMQLASVRTIATRDFLEEAIRSQNYTPGIRRFWLSARETGTATWVTEWPTSEVLWTKATHYMAWDMHFEDRPDQFCGLFLVQFPTGNPRNLMSSQKCRWTGNVLCQWPRNGVQ